MGECEIYSIECEEDELGFEKREWRERERERERESVCLGQS